METKEIKELMLSGKITFTENTVSLYSDGSGGNFLEAYSKPKNCRFLISLCDRNGYVLSLSHEQYNMICKYVESEFNKYHSSNSALTDDDKEHFNSLI